MRAFVYQPTQLYHFSVSPLSPIMTTTLERSLSRTSSMSIPVSSPRLSLIHENTPPALADPSLSHIHDRLTFLDSRLLELRSSVLTKDGYVDRRNREDEHIRREFEAHRSISSRIDLNVVALKTDVDQLKSGISQLKSSIGQSGNETVFLRSDVDRLSKNVQQIQSDVEHLQTDVCGCRVEISKLHATISQLRTDLITLQHETSRHLTSVFNRFSLIEARMKHSERVRFNSLAHTTHAPITPVPVVEEDGSLQWPEYFPRTVWRFWCLKKRSRSKCRKHVPHNKKHLTSISQSIGATGRVLSARRIRVLGPHASRADALCQ